MKRSNKRIAAGALALALVFGGASVPATSEAGLNFDIAASAEDTLAGVRHGINTDIQRFSANCDIRIADDRIIDDGIGGGITGRGVIFPKNFIVGSGKCGVNLTWTLNGNGTLTISGTGKMTDYNWCNSPWAYNRNVKKLIINKGVTSIGDCAFYHCENLTSITIPDGVTSLDGGVFSECDSLTDVTIPNSVTFMGGGVFAWCDNIKSATLSNGLGGLQGTTFEGCTSLTSVTIPDNYTCIDHGAFHGCTTLTSINIPDGMKTINADAFNGCTNLKSITLPKNVTYIGNRAFDHCTSLTIYCYSGTVAETYAKNNNIPYELIDKGTGGTIHDWEEEEREDNGEWSLT